MPEQPGCDERSRAALHEAGHALAAVALGGRVMRASLEADGVGQVNYLPPKDLIARVAIQLAGGRAEEAVYGPGSGDDRDRRRAASLLGSLNTIAAQTLALQAADEKIDAILRNGRAALLALSLRLEHLGSLDGADVLETIQLVRLGEPILDAAAR